MAELRKDPITREWAIIAPEAHLSETGDGCPYCPGNEHQAGPELLAYRDPRTQPDSPGWWVRVVAHRDACLEPGGDPDRRDDGMYDTMRATGAEEVIVAGSAHQGGAATEEAEYAQDALWACRDRYAHWCGAAWVRSVGIWRRYDAEGDEHPQWRLLALPVVPQRAWELAKGMAQYYDYRGRCGVCHLVRVEHEDGRRAVVENRHFLALAPYASQLPYELWIVPRRHQSSLVQAERQEIRDLARTLRDVETALRRALPHPSFTVTFMCAPCNLEGMEHFHWFLRVAPGVTASLDAEMGHGVCVNPVAPEAAAWRLRRAMPVALAREG